MFNFLTVSLVPWTFPEGFNITIFRGYVNTVRELMFPCGWLKVSVMQHSIEREIRTVLGTSVYLWPQQIFPWGMWECHFLTIGEHPPNHPRTFPQRLLLVILWRPHVGCFMVLLDTFLNWIHSLQSGKKGALRQIDDDLSTYSTSNCLECHIYIE